MLYVSSRTGPGRRKGTTSSGAAFLCFLFFVATWATAQITDTQATDNEKPIPLLTGNAGAFSFVTGGHNLIDTQINPILLLPLGDK